jgi:CBS domain-containing protein
MTPEVELMKEDESVEEAAQRMREKQIRRLLVEDINRRIVGVVALGDLALEVPDAQLKGKTLERVSQAPR